VEGKGRLKVNGTIKKNNPASRVNGRAAEGGRYEERERTASVPYWAIHHGPATQERSGAKEGKGKDGRAGGARASNMYRRDQTASAARDQTG
jgi:hypothetical protein